MITVVIFDRYQSVGTALADALQASGRARVLSVLSDASDVSVDVALLCNPRAVLVEVTTGGTALIRRLRSVLPFTRVVATTSWRTDSEERELTALGVQGYFEKQFGADAMERLLALLEGAPDTESPRLVR